MSRVVMINGSPKKSGSASGAIIGELERIAGRTFAQYHAMSLFRNESFEPVLQADAIVIVFPLYVDALPSQLLRLLTRLENPLKQTSGRKLMLFAICNCGFYEGAQTKTALAILRNFADRAGLRWGYGLGIGCGGYLGGVKDASKGPTANVHAALREFAAKIESTDGVPLDDEFVQLDDVFVQPMMPRFLYRLGGHIGWRKMAKANGAKINMIH